MVSEEKQSVSTASRHCLDPLLDRDLDISSRNTEAGDDAFGALAPPLLSSRSPVL